MENENNQNQHNDQDLFSKRVRAGKRRTYFFDVRTTRSSDYYITITESKKRFNDDGYERHKLHLYKEDFNKFLEGMQETISHVKTELMPDYDFDEFNHDDDYNDDYKKPQKEAAAIETTETTDATAEILDVEENVVSEAESVIESAEDKAEEVVEDEETVAHIPTNVDDEEAESWD